MFDKNKWLNKEVTVDEWGRPPSLADVPLTIMTREQALKKQGYDEDGINEIWETWKEYKRSENVKHSN